MTVVLPGDVALSVEELTKLHTDAHEVRYRPTMSIFWRMRDRKAGYSIMASDAGGVDIDADDDADDADDDQGEDGVYYAPSAGEDGEPLLNNISFTVSRGEAVALVGRDESALELAKVLSGMVAPSSGRVVAAGRICPGGELLTNLAKREPHPRRAAHALASLLKIPRRRRRAYVRLLFERVIDEESTKMKPSGRVNPLVRRIALAAQFDPWADVLVIDTWPAPRSFGDQFLDVTTESLARGAAMVIVNPPAWAEKLCSRVVWIERGVVRREGPAEAVFPELKHAIDDDRRRKAHVVHGFDEYLAIQVVETQHAGRRVHEIDVDDDLDVVVHFETSETLENMQASVSFRGPRGTVDFAQDDPRPLTGPGRHSLVVNLPSGCLLDGDYAVDAAFVADHPSGGRTRVAWPQAARIRVTGSVVDDEMIALESGQGDPPGPDATADPSWDYLDAVEV